MRKHSPYLTLVAYLSLTVTRLPAAPASAPGGLVAFSLRAAQQAAEQDPGDPRLRPTGGLGELVGWTIDDRSGDTILLGTPVPDGTPSTTLDEAVALLRLAHAAQAGAVLGVTLERMAGDPENLEVIFFGGPLAGTPMGAAFLEADYLFKLLALGKVPSGVPGLLTYSDRVRQRFLHDPTSEWNILSRFWFERQCVPIRHDQALQIALAEPEHVRIQVFAETLSAEIDGKPAQDEDAAAFVADANREFAQFLRQHPGIRRLAQQFACLSLAEALLTRVPAGTLDYWLGPAYRPRPVVIVPTKPLLEDRAGVGERIVRVVGGVQAAGLTLLLRDPAHHLAALRQAVLLARPSADSVRWTVAWDEEWRLALPGLDATGQAVADAFAAGLQARDAGRLSEAVAAFDRVQRLCPETREAEVMAAVCQRDLAVRSGRPQNLEAVLAVLAGVARDRPRLLLARYELGSTLRAVGRYDDATREFKALVTVAPDYAAARQGLALARLGTGDTEGAIADLHRYVVQAARDATATKQVWEAKALLQRLTGAAQGDGDGRRLTWSSDGMQLTYPAVLRVLTPEDVQRLLPDDARADAVALAFVHRTMAGASLTVRVTPAPTNPVDRRQLVRLVERLEATWREHLEGFEKVRAAVTEINGVPAMEFVLRFRRNGVTVQQGVVLVIGESRAVTLTGTAPAVSFEAVWQACFGPTMSSLELKGAVQPPTSGSDKRAPPCQPHDVAPAWTCGSR